jgi:hypothetical protein
VRPRTRTGWEPLPVVTGIVGRRVSVKMVGDDTSWNGEVLDAGPLMTEGATWYLLIAADKGYRLYVVPHWRCTLLPSEGVPYR